MGNLIFVSKQDAHLIFQEKLFLSCWKDLWERCPWATVFQSPDFVRNWFGCFPEYWPTIITDWDGDSMTGLWVLTETNGNFSAPGFDLAEYQVWIATPEVQGDFLEAALKEFAKRFPTSSIYLKYIPSLTPREAFLKSRFLQKRTAWRPYQQPLMSVDKALLQEELKKKNRKEKINRLKRLGDLQFSKTVDQETFKSQIDEMALQSDFRKGALYNKTFFHDEPQRKEFLMRLFALGHVHVTTLSVGEVLIASNAGIAGPKMVHLQGINSHSPYFSKHSPGILHFLMLGVALADEGIPVFDLTPGGADGYKAVLANEYATAYEWWFGSTNFAFKKRTVESLKLKIKAYLDKNLFFGLDSQGIQNKILRYRASTKRRLNGSRPSYATHFLSEVQAGDSDQILAGRMHSAVTESLNTGLAIKKNRIQDLFFWQEGRAGIPRNELFLDCLNRIEFGQQMFTLTEEENLVGIAWYISSDAKTQAQEARNQASDRPPIILSSCYEIGRERENVALLVEVINQVPADQMPKAMVQFSRSQKSLRAFFQS